MENSDKPDHKQVEDDYSWHTSGNWKTETETPILRISSHKGIEVGNQNTGKGLGAR